MPPGSDPADLARRDPAALKAAVEGAKPFLQFRLERILNAADLSTPEDRARVADKALAAIAEHPDDMVRDQYLIQLATLCRLEPGVLRERLERIRREGPRTPPGRPDRVPARPGPPPDDRDPRGYDGPPDGLDGEWDDWEDGPVESGRASTSAEFRPGLEALRLAIHRPEDVGNRLEAVLFSDPVQRAAFTALVEADDLGVAIDRAPGPAQQLLVRLTVEEPRSEPDEVVTQLVRDTVRREVAQLTVEARTSTRALEDARQVAGWLQELDDPDVSAEASRRLVAWLVVRARTNGSGQDG
jgi:DNA primase